MSHQLLFPTNRLVYVMRNACEIPIGLFGKLTCRKYHAIFLRRRELQRKFILEISIERYCFWQSDCSWRNTGPLTVTLRIFIYCFQFLFLNILIFVRLNLFELLRKIFKCQAAFNFHIMQQNHRKCKVSTISTWELVKQ